MEYHFVEVKTRRPPMQARPQECVTVTKQKRIASAAARFLSQGCRTGKYSSIKGRIADAECRFDVIAVIFDTDGTKIEYYPEAFSRHLFDRTTICKTLIYYAK